MNEQIPVIGKYTKRKIECDGEDHYVESENGFFFLEPCKGLEDALLFEEKDEFKENENEDPNNDTEYPDEFVKKIMECPAVKFYKTDEEVTIVHSAKNWIVNYESFNDAEQSEDLLQLIFDKKKNKKRHNPEINDD